MLKVLGITGAFGRMGTAVRLAAQEEEGFEVRKPQCAMKITQPKKTMGYHSA